MTADFKIAIIGCGPSGMSMLAAYVNAEKNGAKIPEIFCFEKQSEMGGLWNHTWRTGLDEHGEYVHAGMYHGLMSNTAKEIQEIPLYTLDEHFKKPIPSYVSREVIRDYLMGRAKKINIEKFVKFNTIARYVKELPNGQFSIIYENLITKESNECVVDYVVVATGHFSIPNVPSYPGIESFPGRVMHSHDFRKASEFESHKVLLVGNGYSGEDIALQNFKYGAEKVVVSYRSNPSGFKWPKEVTEVPGIIKISGNQVSFKDGSVHEFDDIIFATGYNHHFPFMEEKLRLRCPKNQIYANDLYMGVHLLRNPNVCYMAMHDLAFTFAMFDAQAWYIRDFTLGRIQLPSHEEMSKDLAFWMKRVEECLSFKHCVELQGDYISELVKHTDYPKWDMAKHKKMWFEFEADRLESIVTYREKQYQSLFTGTTATPHNKSWLQCKEYDFNSFVNPSVTNGITNGV